MDQVYPPSKFQCTEPVCFKTYFQEFASVALLHRKCDVTKMEPKLQLETVLNVMKIFDKEERKQLLAKWKDYGLTVRGECTPQECPTSADSRATVLLLGLTAVTDNARQLNTVQAREEHGSLLKDLFEKHQHRTELYTCKTTFERSDGTNLTPGSDFLIAFRVYHPFMYNGQTTIVHSFNHLKFSQEIIALGSNTLADLRDKILCQADIGICAEVEDPKTEVCMGDAKEKYPSGFIFIDNVFYNDTRKETCIDYSEIILKWAKENNIGDMKTASLHTTRLDELTPRYGYPYVYQHQATCEHIFVISNAWLLSASDSLKKEDYPMYTSIQRLSMKHCTLCYAGNAKWICTESERLPHNRTFLCNDCLTSYNYNANGKIGSFKIYPYFDRSCIK